MDIWIIWLIAAVILVLLEVLSQAVWAFCLAAGCLAALVVSLLTGSVASQAIAVAVVAVAAWILAAPVVRKWQKKDEHKSRTGMDALLGRRATVVDEIRPGNLGRARIDGDYWQVKAPGSTETIRRGEEVAVTAYDSIILSVEPLKS